MQLCLNCTALLNPRYSATATQIELLFCTQILINCKVIFLVLFKTELATAKSKIHCYHKEVLKKHSDMSYSYLISTLHLLILLNKLLFATQKLLHFKILRQSPTTATVLL